jgi:4-hydroxybenzoate polyprenyltransferase
MDGSAQAPAATLRSPLLPQLRALARALRLHQWAKNLLVFVPILLSGRLFELSPLATTTVAFLALGLVASGSYLINDLRDLDDDRVHRTKRHRPLASGRLSIGLAILAAALLVASGLAAAALVSARVANFLCLYLVLTLAYTFGLKRVPLLDGLVLATLFTFRLAIGIAAADVRASPWLLTFSMFLFTSLSYARRHAELAQAAQQGATEINGRGYRTPDLPLVLTMGVGAGLGATLIAVLYIIDDAYVQTFYGNKAALWALPPLLFLFVARIWLKCQRNEMPEHPLDFALKDRAALTLAALAFVLFMLAWLGQPLL